MSAHPDLRPAAQRLAGLIETVPYELLGGPTPCEHYAVGDLLDHIGSFALAFAGAAVKKPLDTAPSGDAARLPDDWRTRIPRDVLAVAEAWADPEAWEGTTAAGGVELPADLAGVVALDELVIHGWDVAKATGRPIKEVFGPLVLVPDDAPLFERILGITGRDPAWEPPR